MEANFAGILRKQILSNSKTLMLITGLLLSALSESMAQSQGPNNPTVVTEEGFACLSCPGEDWFNFNNAKLSDGNFAITHLATNPTCFQSNCFVSRALEASSFGFTIPLAVTVTGIQVDVKRTAYASNAIKDSVVLLLKDGVKIPGTNHASPLVWATSNQYVTYGGATDLWGVTWTPTQIDSVGFGVYFKVQNLLGVIDSAGVDHIRVTVFYATSSGPPVAAFSANDTSICVGDSVHFTDQSTGVITSRSWIFQGGLPPTSSSPNPTVTYDTAGQYNVTLQVTDSAGSDTLLKTHYITVNALPAIPTINAVGDTLISSSLLGNQWYLNGILIPGGTGVRYIAMVSGSYTVVVTNSKGCKATSAPEQIIITGVTTVSESAGVFNIIPNPSKGDFILHFISTGNDPSAIIRVSDISGKIVAVQNISIAAGENRYTLDLTGKMTTGIYFIELETGSHILRQKLLIEE